MPIFKAASFQDRQKSNAEAKKALLEKFKARPAADDPATIERQAQRREIIAAREARAAEGEARLRAEAEERARQQAEKHAALQARLKADEATREADGIVEAARPSSRRKRRLKPRLRLKSKREPNATPAMRRAKGARRNPIRTAAVSLIRAIWLGSRECETQLAARHRSQWLYRASLGRYNQVLPPEMRRHEPDIRPPFLRTRPRQFRHGASECDAAHSGDAARR